MPSTSDNPMESSKEKILREQIGFITGTIVFSSHFDDIIVADLRLTLEKMNSELEKLFSHTLSDRKAKLKEGVEKMGKKELRSPRSFGDNEITVDVSAGYNQALADILHLIDKIL